MPDRHKNLKNVVYLNWVTILVVYPCFKEIRDRPIFVLDLGGEAVWTRSSLCSHHRGLLCVWIGQWRSVCKFQVSKETKLECFHDINHLVLFTHPSFLLFRMIFAAARDRNFPSVLCYLNVHSLIPTPSVILMVSECLSPYRLNDFLFILKNVNFFLNISNQTN